VIAAILLTIWISTRLILKILPLEQNKAPLSPKEESHKAASLFFPMIWISILLTLAVLGASLLLILPGIYLSTCFYFAQLILVDQNIRGTKALSASRTLVKGRWWATFGRILVGAIIVGLLVGFLNRIVTSAFDAILPSAYSDPKLITFFVFIGLNQFIQMLILSIFTPFAVSFQVKLYRALQKTR
jgi:hypothetical protein